MRCSRWRSSAAACCATAGAASSARTAPTRRRFVWSLAWWPHAIEHGLHPLLIDLVYAPDGWNLAWTSAIPGPALLAWPLTAAFGPIPAYDVLALAAPGARRLVRVPALPRAAARARWRRWPAASSSASAATRPPRRSTTSTSRSSSRSRWPASSSRATCAARSPTAGSSRCSRSASLGVFATFLETLFWATLGGAFALGAGLALTRGASARCSSAACCWARWPTPSRCSRPRRTCGSRSRIPIRSAISGRGYELDLANLIVPTRVTELRPGLVHDLAEQLGGNNLTEQVGYVGPVLPALAGFALWERAARAARARARADDRRRHAVRARLTARRGRAPHVPRAAVDARRRPAAGEPRAARSAPSCSCGSRSRCVVALLPRRAAGRLRWLAFGLMALTLVPSLDGRLWVTRLDRPALFEEDRWRDGRAPGRERADHPASLRRARRCCGRRRPASASA